jgi:hypothetical protein
LVVAVAAPALAEGYNSDNNANKVTSFAGSNYYNAGFYTRATGYFMGPHGGYTTSTNKCQDCHSTHYAYGAYMLLRANTREAACDYCHGGGGGSYINIMMDNDYASVAATFGTAAYGAGVANPSGFPNPQYNATAVKDTTMGKGTGHTLGYAGKAPADIQPAYQQTQGLACFDCHSPHGNSARIIATIGNPGRAVGNTNVAIAPGAPGYIGNVSADGIIDGLTVAGGTTAQPGTEWGIDPVFGNYKWYGNPDAPTSSDPFLRTEYGASTPSFDSGGARLIYRPIFPAGRWLLLKDPHATSAEGQADTVVEATQTIPAAGGKNKYKIDWSDPMGPADGAYGGWQDNDSDRSFPFAPSTSATTGGFVSLSEFCVDCHDGTAGASTQAATVWKPSASDSTTGGYITAYAHDTQPRH